jgi:hypothetical protein
MKIYLDKNGMSFINFKKKIRKLKVILILNL